MKWDDYVKGTSFVKLFIKGPPRSGKTYLAASASRLGKTLFIDAEGGLITARNVIDKDNLEIEILPITDNPSTRTKVLERILNRTMNEHFDWVVFDSFTELAGQLEDQYSKGAGEVKDWMSIIETTKKIGRYLRDGDFHLIVTCLMKQKDFDPILPGQSSTVIPSFYNTLGMIETRKMPKGEVRALVTHGTTMQSVGDRYGILDPAETIDKDHPELLLQKLVDGIALSHSEKEIGKGAKEKK